MSLPAHPYDCPNAMRHRRLDRDTEKTYGFSSSKKLFTPSNQLLPLGEYCIRVRSFRFLPGYCSSSALPASTITLHNNHQRHYLAPATPFRAGGKLCRFVFLPALSAYAAIQSRNIQLATERRIRNDIGTHSRFRPSRWKIGCGLTSICTKRSPAGPLSDPPARQSVGLGRPSPAGTFTDRVLRFSTRPAPAQVLHGSAIISPRPRQRGQVCCSERNETRLA